MDSQSWAPHYPSEVTQAELSEGLHPVRGFVMAQSLYHAMNLGILQEIAGHPSVGVGQLADSLHLDFHRLLGLLRYLANEEIVEVSGDTVSVTTRGRLMLKLEPWYVLIVGGYSQTLQDIGLLLRDGNTYGTRNAGEVGRGSCGISEYDALPMIVALLERLREKPSQLIDVGCGDGKVLLSLISRLPDANAVGIDPEERSIERATQLASDLQVDDRVRFIVGDSATLDQMDLGDDDGPKCFIGAFLLQEILEQSGRDKIVEMLRQTAEKYAGCFWTVVEVDRRVESATIKETKLGLAYYNPYYLLHDFTEQRLEPSQFWEDLFCDAGFVVVGIETPSPLYDALELKRAYLIASESANARASRRSSTKAGSDD